MYGFPGLRAGITRTCAGYSCSRSYIGGIFQHEIMGLLEYPLYVRGPSFIARRMLEYPLHVRVPALAHLAPAVGPRDVTLLPAAVGPWAPARLAAATGQRSATALRAAIWPRRIWRQPPSHETPQRCRQPWAPQHWRHLSASRGRHSVAGSRRTANHRAPPRLPAGGRSRVLQIVYLPNEDTGQLPSIPELAPESTRNRGRRNLSEAVKQAAITAPRF